MKHLEHYKHGINISHGGERKTISFEPHRTAVNPHLMRTLSFIEVKDTPLDDPASLPCRHPDSRMRTFFFSSALPFVAMEMVLLGCVSGCSRPLWFTRARLRDWDEFQTRKVDLYRWNFFSVKYLGRFSWPVKIMPKTELSSLYIYFFHWIRHKRADHKWSQRYSFKWSAKNVFWPQELIDDRLKRIKGIQFPIHLEQPFPLRCRCSFCRKTSGHHQK